MRNREKSAAQTRRANRGNVPGCLGMEELAMLMGKRIAPDPNCVDCHGKGYVSRIGCESFACDCWAKL